MDCAEESGSISVVRQHGGKEALSSHKSGILVVCVFVINDQSWFLGIRSTDLDFESTLSCDLGWLVFP